MAFSIPKNALKGYLALPFGAEASRPSIEGADFHHVHDDIRRALAWTSTLTR
jgi:hypothetical protein